MRILNYLFITFALSVCLSLSSESWADPDDEKKEKKIKKPN